MNAGNAQGAMTEAWTVALAVVLACPFVFACTGMYVGKKVSSDGTLLIGRTVDTPPWSCCFRATRVPRGKDVKYAYVCTPSVTAVGKGYYPSACANEAGLVISGTVTGHTRREILDIDPKTNRKGVGEFNMPGLVAANCANVREALDYFSKVIAERGHFGSEIYMFADKDEAWYLEAYSGHQWAAVKVPEDKVACFGNQFMIRSFDPDSPDVRHSRELISMPEKAGLLVRGDDGLPDLCLTYATPLGDYSNFRTWFGHKTFSPCTAGEYETKRPMPLFYSPERKVSIDDMFELMRSRYEGTDRCPDEGGSPKVRTIGTTKQATSHVISLDSRLPAKFAGTVWFSLANAEHSVFLPMNAAVTETDEAFSQDDVEKPFSYNPSLAGHAFRRLCALAEQNRRFYGRGVRAWWRARERELLASYPRALAEAVAKDDASVVTDFAKREQSRALNDAKRIFDELMWYVVENNRIEGDGSGATTLPAKPFRPKGLGDDDPADAVYAWWPGRMAQKRKEIAESGGKFDLVFVGDSITHYFGDDNGRGVPVFRELQKTYSILNLGYSGQKTENMIWRMTHGELDGYEAKAVMVMAGTNNGNPATDVARGIRRLVEVIRERQPKAKVLLLPVFPRGEKPDNPIRCKYEKVKTMIRGLADEKDVIWGDINDRFLEPDGTATKEVFTDFCHLTEKGYRIWRDAMLPYFREICGK